jgi:Protein of unknown function (DUF3072)
MNAEATPNPEKPPEQWVTGEEPMTGPQISYLPTLCREAEVSIETRAAALRVLGILFFGWGGDVVSLALAA